MADAGPTPFVFAPSVEPLEADGIAALASTRRAETVVASTPWKVLIVDDDEQVHAITEMALRDIEFQNRSLSFLHAYSGQQAIEMAEDHPEVAVIFMDVVMERDHAGLEAIQFIREQLGNSKARIIVRTGQPGEAPEAEVITRFDINDYKEKTELTRQKLFSTTYAALRGYADIIALHENKMGLEAVINASSSLFERQSIENFSGGVLRQITALLQLTEGSVFARTSGFAARPVEGELHVVSAIGEYAPFVGRTANEALSPEAQRLIKRAMFSGRSVFEGEHYSCHFSSVHGGDYILYISGLSGNEPNTHILDLFCNNASVAFENVHLKKDVEETQREIVHRLSEAVESRSEETGNHVRRVGEYSKLLGRAWGLSHDESELLLYAAPLHDVGKIAIPDSILKKPARLEPDEWDIMKTHAIRGYDMLATSKREILRAGAIIAKEHHEKWDGSGYPLKLSGTQIHLYGRITAVADVFDALTSERCYKEAWPLDRALGLISAESGKHFDPTLVGILLRDVEQVLALRSSFRDEPLPA